MSPTLGFEIGQISKLPVSFKANESESIVTDLIKLARTDWDYFETSWDFQTFPLLNANLKATTVEASFDNWQAQCIANIKRMQELETENNRLFIEAYGLEDELTPEVPEAQITLDRADREADIRRLVSYAIGCMMGRYSLDQSGLVYANSGNRDFDASLYQTFAADPDGIVPVMENDWFADDAAHRFVEFIATPWPQDNLEENLWFIAASLGANRNEQPRETIRRYFATGFFKDHLKTYKKRPIYWLFTSGKQRAFQALVYLHRYNEGTLARMRTEYVIPLQGKIAARIEHLATDITNATSTTHRRKLEKEREALTKQQNELRVFDEKLRHYADQRIALDLDDGVKVNYGKLGDLLAEVKAVTGGSDE
jgi:type II restriction/modification system DNA methylase subunit YeeA